MADRNFVQAYTTRHQYIDSGHCLETYGFSPTQIRADINWLLGVITTIVHNLEDPAITSAAGDGIIALENLIATYSNSGQTFDAVLWGHADIINLVFNPKTMTYNAYMLGFKKLIVVILRLNPSTMDNYAITFGHVF